MLNSETLEVGIGMAFLFLLMSLICTAVKEWLEGVLKWRAMDLERGLRTLLDDHDGATTAFLYRHPLIYSLFQGRYDPGRLRSSWLTPGKGAMHVPLSARRHLPSYIPAAHFATALLDLVARGPVSNGIDAHDSTDPRALSMTMLRERAAALSSPHLRRVLLSAIDHAAGDLDELKHNVQQWFDGTMDRASGWYKRRTQAVLFIVGVFAAAALNVDALHVMQRLTADKTLRDVVVREAASAKAPDQSASGAQAARIQEAREEIAKVGMPVGWREAPGTRLGRLPEQLCDASKPEPAACEPGQPITWLTWVRVLLGWLVTAFATMLGAPFWFDVLNKFMVIRSTVKPHEKSPEEGSEDRQVAETTGDAGSAAGAVAARPAPSPADAAAAAATAAPVPLPPPAPTAPFVPHAWRPGFSNPNEVTL